MGAAVRALLAGAVDYAGLFPPAALPLAGAAREYAGYLGGTSSWMLGRFVVPAGRLEELALSAAEYWRTGPAWGIAAVGAATDMPTIAAFNARRAPAARVDMVEVRCTSPAEVIALNSATEPEDRAQLRLHVEVPLVGELEPLLLAVKAVGACAKVRTGGVTADAFPTAVHIARFLGVCATLDVPFKATAGLHHPLRGEYPLTYESGSARTTMFGFLNLFLAALLARDGADEGTVVALLEESDASSFNASADTISWRGHLWTAAEIAEGRAHSVLSFGSCSFTEPTHDLSMMGLT